MRITEKKFKDALQRIGCEIRLGDIHLYADDPQNLEGNSRTLLERHLKVCKRCREELEFARVHLERTSHEEVPDWVRALSGSFQSHCEPGARTPETQPRIVSGDAACPETTGAKPALLVAKASKELHKLQITRSVHEAGLVSVARKVLTEPLHTEEDRLERLFFAAVCGPLLDEAQRLEVFLEAWRQLELCKVSSVHSSKTLVMFGKWSRNLLSDEDLIYYGHRWWEKRLIRAASETVPSVPENASAFWTAVQWVSQAPLVPRSRFSWISKPWRPVFAGARVTASDVSEQSHRFEGPDVDILVCCRWRSAHGNKPAYLWISWKVSIRTRKKLYARFTHPETEQVMSDILLGTNLEGEATISSRKLGFDPSATPWSISLRLQ